ncbi:phage baseplate protein [Pseudescherichia sp.]|uniref:phage baseplate protein n=1 Tax=Pseudescherichia sp. TaxID=2055881 RepID=UPI0028A24186|nr:hypothetical protein [Pseudescherichia sp.]
MDYLSTLFHQHTRQIGVIIPSVVTSEIHTDTLTITEHPIEDGAVIADHAYKNPAELKMKVGFAGGGTLLDFAGSLTATSLLGLSPQETYQQLLDLQARRIPFSVTTGKRQYNNMLIATLSVTTESESENVLFADLTLKEVILVQTKEVYVAEKSEMKMGVNTAEVRNTGTKTTKPAGSIALTSGGQ